MFKKLINKIIMGTECYLLLKNRLKEVERENQEMIQTFEIQSLRDKTTQKRIYRSKVLCIVSKELESIITKNKTKARKIVRLVNQTLPKKDKTAQQIKDLCNQIIKGE